jgi:hypothetical protein
LDNDDGISKDQSTLVQKNQSALRLNVSSSKNSSGELTRGPHNNQFSMSEELTHGPQGNVFSVSKELPPFCDRSPTGVSNNDVKLEAGKHRNQRSPSEILVDEMFGETPKQSPTQVSKSPSDCLVEEVLSSGVLNSPFISNIGK